MTTLSLTITANADDGQSGTGAGYNNSGANIILGAEFGTANGFWRFLNVTIPQGSTINACTFTGTKVAGGTGTADVLYAFVMEANPATISSGSDYNARALTTSQPTQTGLTGASGTFTSPSLVAAMQEVVNQGAFASGNAVVLFIKDNGSQAHYGGFQQQIKAKAIDAGGGGYGTLDVDYTPPATAKQGAAKTRSLKLFRRQLVA